mgnify:CR=1 FL=1
MYGRESVNKGLDGRDLVWGGFEHFVLFCASTKRGAYWIQKFGRTHRVSGKMDEGFIRRLFTKGVNQILYQIVVFLHVVSVLGYLLAHGASVSVSYAIKKERDVNRIRVLLDLSAASYPVMLWTLLAVIVFGLAAAFLNMVWWKFGWIWISIIVLVVIVVLMAIYGAGVFGEIRKAVGLPYMVKGKPFPAEPAKSDEEVFAVVSKVNPTLLLVIGYGGFAIITWMMTAKPF